jgi:hypothetical protein
MTALAFLISTWLIGGNLVADRLGKPLEQAIAQYNSQHPAIAPNESAHQLQALLVKFGLSLDHFGDGSKVKVEPQKAAIAEWQQITLLANKYLSSQIDTIEDKATISPLPPRLLGYLQIHRDDVKAVYDYWINNPQPYLGQGHSSSSTWDLMSLQTIEFVDLINKIKEPGADITRELKALQQTNSLLRSHHIFSTQTAKLAKSIQNIPVAWEEDSFKDIPHRTLPTHFREQTVSISNELQNPANIENSLLDIKSPWWWIFRYHHLVKPYLRVAAADHYQQENEYISRLEQQEVCYSSGGLDFQSPSPIFSDLLIPLPSRIFFQEAISDLQWELTTGVRQVRSKFDAGQNAAQIASEFNLSSKVCLGEKWSARAKNNAVTISFSHPPNWKALRMQPLSNRLIYTILP